MLKSADVGAGQDGQRDRPCLPDLPKSHRLGMRLRSILKSDEPFLAELYASTRAGELAPLPWSDDQKSAFLMQQFRAQHDHYMSHYPQAHWLLLEISREPAGRLYLEWWPSEIRIIDIALMPAHRGKGLGRALLEDVQALAEKDGLKVGIHVEKHNPAMSLYRRLGFKVIEDKGVYDLLIWPDGRSAQD